MLDKRPYSTLFYNSWWGGGEGGGGSTSMTHGRTVEGVVVAVLVEVSKIMKSKICLLEKEEERK